MENHIKKQRIKRIIINYQGTMATSEIMIGDYFHSKNHNVDSKIIGIENNAVWLEHNLCWERHFIDEIEPIKLTDAILKANGFNREGGASYWHGGDRDACILYWSEDKKQLVIGSSCDDCMIKINVRYVHELQHAFKMAGINKEIKLED